MYLFEANIICILSETPPTHVETILSDQTMGVLADTTENRKKYLYDTIF